MNHIWMRVAGIAYGAGFVAILVSTLGVLIAAAILITGGEPPGMLSLGIVLSLALAIPCGLVVMGGAATIRCRDCGRSLFEAKNLPASEASFIGGRTMTIALRLAAGQRTCQSCGASN